MLVFSKIFTVCQRSDRNIYKLEHVQIIAAKIISGAKKFDHIFPVL